MPSVAFAPGAVVSTSMKAEVLAATHVARSLRGKCWLFDPGGTIVPAGVIGLRWNPLCDVTDWDSARSVAARLTGPARAGAGASHDGDHWTDRAETWLAVLLYAARLSTCDGDLAALARWSMNPTGAGPECEAILIVAGQDGDDGAGIAATLLGSLLSVPDRERESIASTLGRIMNIYTSTAALRAGVNPNFDVQAFVRIQRHGVHHRPGGSPTRLRPADRRIPRIHPVSPIPSPPSRRPGCRNPNRARHIRAR